MKNLLIVFLVVLAACVQTPPLPDSNAITRVEVTPAALLTTLGDKQRLVVRAFNASGKEVSANAVWTSSNPEQVSTTATGELEAKTALGASQIVAEVAGIKSAPILVSIAQPVTGVTLISDAQVRGEATLVDPNAEADSDNPYEVLLTGITPPAVGSLLLGREGKAIGGEVISSVQEGDAVRVRLKLVPITQLMQTAQIKETLDYTNLQPNFPTELIQGYDIALKDGEYIFTPKPTSSARVTPQAVKEFNLGPYKCDFTTPELPVSLGQPGQFSLKFNPTLEIDFDRDTGLRKLIARAELGAEIKASLVLSAGGIVNLDCVAPLFTKMLPLPGWAGLILAGELKAGVGFEIEGSLNIPLLGVELNSETKGKLEMGLDCTAGECKQVRSFNPVNTNTVRFITPSVANIRTELSVYGYAFAKLKMGATLLEKLRMDVVTAGAGLKLEGSFAPPSTQLEPNNNTLEPDYKSDYKLGLLAEVVVGSSDIAGKNAFKKLLLKLGISKLSLLKFQTAKTLANSPKGDATQDKKDFKAGDTVNFNVKLDPATTDFPFVGYNVERIFIMRKDGSSPAETLAVLPATEAQLEFKLPWVADADSTSPKGSAFYAFVDTKLPVPFDLELGKVSLSADPLLFKGTFALDSTYTNLARGRENKQSYDNRIEIVTQYSGEIEQTRVGNRLLLLTKLNAFKSKQEENLRREGSQSYGSDCQYYEVSQYNGTYTSLLTSEAKYPVYLKFDNRLQAKYEVSTGGADILRNLISRTQKTISNKTGSACTDSPVSRNSDNSFSDLSMMRYYGLTDFVGNITRDAEGNGIIDLQDAGTIDYCNSKNPCQVGETKTSQYSFKLNLKQGKTSKDADLELGILAPASATLGGTLTYAVNLRNKSTTNDATNIRAEFYLPEGFTIVATPGWTGCTTIQTTVTCTAPTLAPNDRRALLIDVQAPTSIGAYIVSARVSSNETDPDQSNNFDTGATLLLEPPEPSNP